MSSNSGKPELISLRINWSENDNMNSAAQAFVKDCQENNKKVSTALKELIYEHIKSRTEATDKNYQQDEDPYPWKCAICGKSDKIVVVGEPDITSDKVKITIDCKNGHGLRLKGKRSVSLETWKSIKENIHLEGP